MKRLDPITDAEWEAVNEWNKFIMDDFLTNSTELSPKSIKAYYSSLRIFFVWVKNNIHNKKLTEITSLEYKRYQNWLVNRGCSSADVCNKRAAISSLNNYIEIYYQSEFPTFRNFINKSIKRPPPSFVHEKEPLTKAEFASLLDELSARGDWQKVAYLKFTFETGCRRSESAQVMKDIVNAKPTVKEKVVVDEDGIERTISIVQYKTPPIRCKGAGRTGKVRNLVFGQDTMDAFQKWLSVRGDDDCPAMFITKHNGEICAAQPSTFNSWASSTFTKIVGRRVHPHLFRESRATQAVIEEGKDIKAVQALLGHNSSTTTEIYVIRDDSDDMDELFMP